MRLNALCQTPVALLEAEVVREDQAFSGLEFFSVVDRLDYLF